MELADLPEWTDDEIDPELFEMIKCLSDGTEIQLSCQVPLEKQLKFLEELSLKNAAMRECCNPECNWEGMDTPDLRFCPVKGCEWEIVGWKSEKY